MFKLLSCTGTVPELYRNCTASCDLSHLCNLLCPLYGSCRVSGTVPELYRNCTFVTRMYSSLYPLCTRLCILFVPFYLEFARIPDTILDTAQYRNCTGTVPELYRNCTASCDLSHLYNLVYRNCTGTVTELYRVLRLKPHM